MGMLRRLIRIILIQLWLPVFGMFSFFVQLGGWSGIKRVSHCTRIWGAVLARILGIRIKVVGDRGNFTGGLIVSNHQSYLDILVHSAVFPIRFTPKAEIRKWPLLGPYLGISRPIWIERGSRQQAQAVANEFEATMEHGIPLLVYPEGTTTDGKHGLLPFKSTPFEAVAGKNFPILPVVTVYHPAADGEPLAWYGDMTLMPHLWRVLSYRRIEVEVHLLPVLLPGERDRKTLAVEMHRLMSEIYKNLHGGQAVKTEGSS